MRRVNAPLATWIAGSSKWCGGGAGGGAPGKDGKWIKMTYFPADGPRHWVFTGTLLNQKGQGRPIQLMSAAQVRIIRYVKIRSAVNPYDPKWELYLEARWGWQLAQTRTGYSRIEDLRKRQWGRCVACGQ